jgi:hypothetical protein
MLSEKIQATDGSKKLSHKQKNIFSLIKTTEAKILASLLYKDTIKMFIHIMRETVSEKIRNTSLQKFASFLARNPPNRQGSVEKQ